MPSDRDLDRLQGIAAEFAADVELRDFGRYCDLRGRGLRSPAFAALEAFITLARAWPFERRKAISLRIAQLARGMRDAGLLTPQPLLAQVLLPAFEEWSRRDEASAEPHLWLGLLRHEGPDGRTPADHLRLALDRDPHCDEARRQLAEWLLSDVEFNQHHLPDDYIGDPAADIRALDEAEALLAGLPKGSPRRSLEDEASQLRRRLVAWLSGKPRPKGRLRPV
jgi:hypothetical protein